MSCRSLLVTNNPFLKEISKVCDFVDGSTLDVLRRARDMVHAGWVLLSHPMYGNLRPHQHPYRSILLEEPPAGVAPTDLLSLEYIENAILTYSNQSREIMRPEDVPLDAREDYAFVDAELIKESLSRYGLIKHVRIQHSEKGVRMDGGIE